MTKTPAEKPQKHPPKRPSPATANPPRAEDKPSEMEENFEHTLRRLVSGRDKPGSGS